MPRLRPALLFPTLVVAAAACGSLKVVPVPEPGGEDREARPATARPVQATGSAWASQLALDACRTEIARRWRVPETRVRTSSRAHDASDGSDLVNWDIDAAAAGSCRVDSHGTVLSVETERTPQPRREVAREPHPAAPPPSAPLPRPTDPADRDAEAEPPRVTREQLDACRGTVVRETGARPDEVGLSAGTPDDRGTVLVDWSLGTGHEGTCLVDSSAAVVQFRR
ncbi:MAG: hypothetical protein ACREOC_12355 [Gemmatimonadales bacterium]